MRSKLILAVTVGAVALGFGGAASEAAQDRTVVHYFHAFNDGRIAPAVHVLRTSRGYCWETSGVESRRYAWRCFRGNYIHDPCFSATLRSRFVLCPIQPWSDTVLRLRLTRPLPAWALYRYNPRLPVGIWTTTGKHCAHSSGASGPVDGKEVTYTCVGGGLLAGLANRSRHTWTIWYAAAYKAHQLARVGVTDAWW